MDHIPGPYEVARPGEDGNESENLEIHDGFGRTATVYGECDEENWATARLLAAAPDLVEALKYCRLWHQGDKYRFSEARGHDRYEVQDLVHANEVQAWYTQMKRIDDALAKAGIN